MQGPGLRTSCCDPHRALTRVGVRLAGALLVALAGGGCTEPPGAGPAGGGGGAPADLTLVDDAGRKQDLSRVPVRVVSLLPAVTELLVSIGASDRLVARTRYDHQESLAHLPSVGGGLDPGIEFMVSLTPDLVVLWPGAHASPLLDRLSDLELPWYAAAIQTVDDFERHARNLGLMFDLEAAADSLIAYVGAGFDAALDLSAGREPVDVMYVVQRDPPMTVGPGTFLDSIFTVAGAHNVFGDVSGQWPLVSMEQVVVRAPEFVLVPTSRSVPRGGDSPVAAAVARELGMDGVWMRVPAVASGRVIALDGDLFARPGPRMGEATLHLARLLHPRPRNERRE